MSEKMTETVSCQGVEGAFSHLAAKAVFPEKKPVFFSTFDAALEAVENEKTAYAVLPVENSAAGRVADMHRLLGDTTLFVTGEHFLRIRHCLLGTSGADLSTIRSVHSHPQALSQCALFLKTLSVDTETSANTAVAAREVAQKNDPAIGAVASKTAAELYGLKVLKENIEDSAFNTTRFWILSKTPAQNVDPDRAVTSFIFWVKNLPAVLYKCLGGFATNGIDLLRLESYVDPERFLTSAGFLVDVAAHPETPAFKRAFEELNFFAQKVKILGTYNSDPYRLELKNRQQEKCP